MRGYGERETAWRLAGCFWAGKTSTFCLRLGPFAWFPFWSLSPVVRVCSGAVRLHGKNLCALAVAGSSGGPAPDQMVFR